MIMTRHPRLRAPTVMAIGGSVIAAAVLIGQGWAAAVPVEVVTIAAAIGYYLLGGRGGDLRSSVTRPTSGRRASGSGPEPWPRK